MGLKYYDTSSMLKLGADIFNEPFCCSYITLHELEHIKTSGTKDEETKYKARQIVRLLDEHFGEYEVVTYGTEEVKQRSLDVTNDNIICAGAFLKNTETDVIFYTDDICLKLIARQIFDLRVKSVKDELVKEEYTGYKELSDEEMADYYSNPDNHDFNCLTNQYVFIRDINGKVSDSFKITDNGKVKLYDKPLKSLIFGDKIKPKDIYQQFAIDSLMTNQVTAISGKAGSGKTLLCLCAAMNLIESGKYDRLVVLFNPTKAKGSADMGYYSGDMLNKSCLNFIGNTLTTKLGDRFSVDLLIKQDKLKLISMADQRGMEVLDNEILYISECQNTSVDLLKLCLTRPSEKAKVFIEGDFNSQVDSYAFESERNGMKRAIEILKGQDIFGYVKLQNVWRSKLADLVDKM